MSKSRSFGIAGRGVSPLAASVTFFLCRRRALDTVARLGRAIRLSSGSSDITAACDDDGATVKSVNLFFISPTAFRAWAMLTLPVWLRPGSLLLTTLSPDVVSGALHFSLMISTAPRYCSTYVFFVLNIFKISTQNCQFPFTRYTILQSHARPISVSHRYRQSVQCIHSRLSVWETCDQMSGDYMFTIKWHAINCPNDYVSTLLIVMRLTVSESSTGDIFFHLT